MLASFHNARAGVTLWRAHLGHSWRTIEEDNSIADLPTAFPTSRMKPRNHRALEGRKGIPYLYLSTTSMAAMSEVRPWIGAFVSVAQFQIIQEVKIVDCSSLHGQYFNLAFGKRRFTAEGLMQPDDSEVDQIVWAAIDTAFAEPITHSYDGADCAATQIIAELFRTEGHDGVAYKSAFGAEGYSVVLFDLDKARQINGMLYKVESVDFKFTDSAVDLYTVKDDDPV